MQRIARQDPPPTQSLPPTTAEETRSNSVMPRRSHVPNCPVPCTPCVQRSKYMKLCAVSSSNLIPLRPTCPLPPFAALRSKYMKKCSRCLRARYCSPECFKDGWAVHKKACEVATGLAGGAAGAAEAQAQEAAPAEAGSS